MALALAGALIAGSPARGEGLDRWAEPVAEAARRFDLEPRLIRAVIAAESGGDPKAVSSAGAMGLMQVMPGTWAQLRARLGLGADPFDPADNVLAGAAYLRELRDRFGLQGALAAYNAGPARYAQSLQGRPLPLETRRYVAKLEARLGAEVWATPATWRASGLFPARRAPPAEGAGGLFARREDAAGAR